MQIKKVEQKDLVKAIDVIWDTMVENNLIKRQYTNYESKQQYYNSIIIEYLYNEIIVVGAYQDDEILGTIIVKNNNIRSFYVRSKFQNQKIGKALISYVLKYLKDNNCHIVRLNSSEYAHDIYKKMGFVDSDEYSSYKYPMKYIMEE